MARDGLNYRRRTDARFSLVAEIGWLARFNPPQIGALKISFSLVAEIGWLASDDEKEPAYILYKFQSRCRDWVVGEMAPRFSERPPLRVSVSLPRLGGWREDIGGFNASHGWSFSLVAEIGWLASS